MTTDLLQTIVAAARRAAELRAAHAKAPGDAAATKRLGGAAFEASLRRPGVRVIAECKRRSPSRGVLRRDYNPAAIAASYERAGAAAISVLTEPTFFSGSLDHLRLAREAVRIPILRKDFIVTEFQIDESAEAGADAILLIVGAMPANDLARLITHAHARDLAALVEVHDRDELAVAREAGATVVGVNSRNLRTLDVDIAVFDELAPLIPASAVAIAESGLRTPADLSRLRAGRYDAFLIGERLMTTPDPGAALNELLAAAASAREAAR
jgi:indole-3-glycerol phosphate synthase